MKESQFPAWLFGFAEHIASAPSPQEWARIREMLGRVEADEAPPAPVVNVYCEERMEVRSVLGPQTCLMGAGDHPGSNPR